MNDAEGGRKASAKPHFFLSYAHMPPVGTRNPNARVSQFYEDLCEAVLQLTPLPTADPVGFMDETMHQGDNWAAKISEALATCRVFVPLYHPRLFRSTPCGQEWYTFAQRAANAPGGAAQNSAIVPVLWVGMQDGALPPVAHAVQYNHPSFPRAYAEDGLYALMAQRHHQGLYEKVVYKLARRIVEVALETVVPVVEPVDFTTNPSAFPGRSPADELIIAVLAFKDSEVPAHRDAGYYGARRTDWQPYLRGGDTALAEKAMQLARQCDLNPTVHEFDLSAGRLMELERPQGPGVVLLDRWVLQDPGRRELVREFARRNPAWVAVVEPWNRDDPQCVARAAELLALSNQVLGRGRAPARPSFRPAAGDPADPEGVPTATDFGLVFQHAAIRAQKAFKERALPRPPATGEGRPRLSGAFDDPRPPIGRRGEFGPEFGSEFGSEFGPESDRHDEDDEGGDHDD
ncbi:TIR-like protein FxsC [Kitasatospora sp. NBC_01287]|uniref:TIR-like protein FxsC n=1 Tax=Kitasatospora sp. NBC_01287 TaxID=2903573 RepID=UPI0022560C8A|nr:TIR-like protein FxsC [Kitasatospora sp. NBC_01287]MCX4747289.1 TIR-like protein FxsC [Kitasatospora sp. NBC_01287]